MRHAFAPAASCLALVACAAAAPPPPAPITPIPPVRDVPGGIRPNVTPVFVDPTMQERATQEQARWSAKRLLGDLANRIVEVRENRVASGPGGSVLADVTLFESPYQSNAAGLCQLNAHVVTTGDAPPWNPDQPPSMNYRIGSIHTDHRFYLRTTVIEPQPAETRPQTCDEFPLAHYFTAASLQEAQSAMEVYERGRRWAGEGSRAVTIECTRFDRPCADGSALLVQNLRPQNVRRVSRVTCEAGDPAGANCWRFELQDVGGEAPGAWTVLVRGPQRPMRMILRQDMPPVT